MLWLYKAKDDHSLVVGDPLSISTLLPDSFLGHCSSVRCWLLQPITTLDSYAAGGVTSLALRSAALAEAAGWIQIE
jgi:hypothetical protein